MLTQLTANLYVIKQHHQVPNGVTQYTTSTGKIFELIWDRGKSLSLLSVQIQILQKIQKIQQPMRISTFILQSNRLINDDWTCKYTSFMEAYTLILIITLNLISYQQNFIPHSCSECQCHYGWDNQLNMIVDYKLPENEYKISTQTCLAFLFPIKRAASLQARNNRQRVTPTAMALVPHSKNIRMRASMVKMQAMVIPYRSRDSGMMCSRSWQYARDPFYRRSTPERKQMKQKQPSVSPLSTKPTRRCPVRLARSVSHSWLFSRQLPMASILFVNQQLLLMGKFIKYQRITCPLPTRENPSYHVEKMRMDCLMMMVKKGGRG